VLLLMLLGRNEVAVEGTKANASATRNAKRARSFIIGCAVC